VDGGIIVALSDAVLKEADGLIGSLQNEEGSFSVGRMDGMGRESRPGQGNSA